MTSPQQYDCIFCKDSFKSKEELQIHFRKHGDPKFNQSLRCNVNKNQSEMGSQAEQGLTSEVVSCDVCSEVFPTISKAITHKHKMHPDHDAKYFCPWCGKLFTMKHLYNKHVESTHDNKMEAEQSGFHCDYCEVDFFVPSAMLYHNKFFHRQDTELAAIGHSKKKKVYNEETMQIYYCPFCGEEYCNKVNLHKHMGDDHIDENQTPDDVLRCPLCEAVFYHLDAYELHLTFHSTADLYTDEKSGELASQITEFSLETVSPIMEKVENESQEEELADASQIEDFLQQALNESKNQDNSNDSLPKEKRKKHKKHKKSKKEKAAITLDEFLTMNTDVFGEGIDFQGVEEVPTQIVTKQLNKKTQAVKKKPGPKPLPSELAKLKKQGLIIKKNRTQIPGTIQGVNIRQNKQVGHPVNVVKAINKIKTLEQNKPNVTNTPNEVLSKFLNQSNSQIKIVKKSAGTDTKETLQTENTVGSDSNKDESSRELCQVQLKHASESQNDGTLENEKDPTAESTDKSPNNIEDEEVDKIVAKQDDKDSISQKELQVIIQSRSGFNDTKTKIECQGKESPKVGDLSVGNKVDNKCIEKENKESSDKYTVIHNLGQHITIKSLPSPKKSLITEKDICEKGKETTSKEIEQNKIVEDSENGTESNSNTKSLKVLKHLSHLLTVKPVNKQNSPTLPNITESNEVDDKTECTDDIDEALDINGREQVEDGCEAQEDLESDEKSDIQNTASKFEALKNLSTHITIKSVSQSNSCAKTIEKPVQDLVKNNFDNDNCGQRLDKSNNKLIENFNKKKNLTNTIIKKSITNINSETKQSSPNLSPKVINKSLPDKELENTVSVNERINKRQISEDVLKRFPNVTAKSVPLTKSSPNLSPKVMNKTLLDQEQETTMSVNENITKRQFSEDVLNRLPNVIAKPVPVTNYPNKVLRAQPVNLHKLFKKPENNDDTEVFNIEDSDDEYEKSQEDQSHKPQIVKQVIPQKTTAFNKVEKSNEVFKTLSKHITIKPTTQPKQMRNETLRDFGASSDEEYYNPNESDETVEKLRDSNNENSITLHNRLKKLSGVTVKSKNLNSDNHTYQIPVKENKCVEDEEYNSDSNISGNVKITELPDDFTSDDDTPLVKGQTVVQSAKNVTVQEPDNSDSDHEEQNEADDIKNKLKPGTVSKPQNIAMKPACLNNLKNVTIKSTKQQLHEQNLDNSVTQKVKTNINNQNKDLSLKPYRPAMSVSQDDDDVHDSMSSAHKGQNSAHMNTINKQISVQTFKTQTVIQEVTTTVTKTIRTVNQTVQQEMRSMNSSMPLRPQKIQSFRQNQPFINTHGRPTRPTAPNMGTRIKTASPVVRPVVGTSIRPSNQLVPVRPAINVARPSNPNMNMKRPAVPVTSSYKPIAGRPLKIAASALMQSPKRSAASEASGPFSCFKKAKESLIPGVEMPSYPDETVQQFASSQVTKSNFSRVTESVKGNSMFTATKTKSEYSASSEQLNRLNSLTGLKVVKSSQIKQSLKVEETTEVNASKRSALAAIEKLQKQGLLVKKPRIEELDDNEHNNSEDDFYDT